MSLLTLLLFVATKMAVHSPETKEKVCSTIACYNGPSATGKALLQPFEELKPIANLVNMLSVSAILNSMFYNPSVPTTGEGGFSP